MAHTARMNINCIGDEGDDIRVRPNVFQLTCQIILLPLIVGIEKTYPSARGLSYPCISRCTHPTIHLMDDSNCPAILLQRLRRCICRTVVDDNNLVILESLPKNTINRFGNEAGPVVSRDDDRKHGARFRFRVQSSKILHHLVSAVAFRWLATSRIVISDPSGCKCAVLVTTNVELHGARVCPAACETLISIMRKWQHSSAPGVRKQRRETIPLTAKPTAEPRLARKQLNFPWVPERIARVKQ
jgi:hypothetical protein